MNPRRGLHDDVATEADTGTGADAVGCAGYDPTREDTGGILVFVLMVATLAALAVLPMLNYAITVYSAGQVQSNRTEAIELANGGTWVAMANERQLYDLCEDPDPATPGAEPVQLPSSLPGVTTTCQLLDTASLRPATQMPFHVATVQADEQIPAAFVSDETYTNPNSASGDALAWLSTPDWTSVPTAGKVWIPQLPVPATSNGGDRATFMRPGTFDITSYSSCRVFFPGTYDTELVIDEPAYFTSGVYYFTEPIILRDGADVVVGNGEDLGCTTDFEAASPLALEVPEPLNISGLGGTFVLGGAARIVVDDAGTADISFAINQRYVAADETSVQASSDVAIVSVNGQHAPLAAGESLGDDFVVPGVTGVPASTIGIEGNPSALTAGYEASTMTVKPSVPDVPLITSVEAFQVEEVWEDAVEDGILVVAWDEPNANGSPITAYTAHDDNTGNSCTVSVPAESGWRVPTSCAITGLRHQNATNASDRPRITVTATNGVGTSPVPAPLPKSEVPRIDLYRNNQAPEIQPPPAPVSAAIGASYSDGLEVSWLAPTATDAAPITGYRVVAVTTLDPTDPSATPGPDVTCEARFDELGCVLALDAAAFGYDIEVVTLADHPGLSTPVNESVAAVVGSVSPFVPGVSPSPPAPVAPVTGARVPEPILDFSVGVNSTMDIRIDGYVAVPQGRILIEAADLSTSSVELTGGVVAGQLDIDPATAPTATSVVFDNPVAQKRVRIRSTYDGQASATSDAVIQVNRSGSLAVNSWIVQ